MNNAGDPASEIYRLALHSAPSGIMLVDEQGAIRYVNQTLADMFGYPVADLIGEPVEVLLPDQFVDSHRAHVRNYAKNPTPRSMGSGRDLEAIARDRRRFPVEIGLRPVSGDSGPMVVATVVDISVRKAMEERLRRHEEELEQLVAERTRELEQAQREKERMLDQLIQAEKMTVVGTLVSGIGHEINNPLYVLQATAEALQDETDIDQCRSHGASILKQALRIAETVKNLSRYARPGNDRDLQPVSLDDVIADALELARQATRDDRVEFAVAHAAEREVMARFEELVQVVFNLLRNAVQAIPGRGKVDILTAQRGNWITLRIRDNGIGIQEENLSRVFDPFFTTKGPDEGEGLGLYIVRQIIARYGGSISVENNQGGGTQFEIRFPVADKNMDQEELR